MCRQWDAVQDFFAKWEKDNEIQFCECCQEFLDLEEFANLFRQHFRNFLVEQLERRIEPEKATLKNRFRGSNPFRGLNFFDFEHAAFYYGRTRAIGEVLDALKRQVAAKKSLVLVLGPSGSGKTSLLRAGVLPLLTQGGTPVGNGPWSRLITRPGVGDPIDTLAAALVARFALAALQDPATPDDSLSLASRLKKDPENAASRVAEVLGKRKMRLALVVDQLEELFFGVSPVLQRKYVTALWRWLAAKGSMSSLHCAANFTRTTSGSPNWLTLLPVAEDTNFSCRQSRDRKHDPVAGRGRRPAFREGLRNRSKLRRFLA